MLSRPTPPEGESDEARFKDAVRLYNEAKARADAARARRKAYEEALRAAEEQKARLAAVQEAQHAAARVAQRPLPGE